MPIDEKRSKRIYSEINVSLPKFKLIAQAKLKKKIILKMTFSFSIILFINYLIHEIHVSQDDGERENHFRNQFFFNTASPINPNSANNN